MKPDITSLAGLKALGPLKTADTGVFMQVAGKVYAVDLQALLGDVERLEKAVKASEAKFKKLEAEVDEDEERRRLSQPEAERALANRLRYARPAEELRLEYSLILLAGGHPPAEKAGYEAFLSVVGLRAIEAIVRLYGAVGGVQTPAASDRSSGMANTLQRMFAGLSEDEARAVYHALAQFVDNEASRDDVDDALDESDPTVFKGLNAAMAVVERGDAVMAGLAEGAAENG